MKRKKYPTRIKARKILHEGRTRGHKLTSRARKFMGWVAGGRKPRKRSRR